MSIIKLFNLSSRQPSNKNGFVILYAVIITTVVLLVGMSLMNIITKQLVLSSISRNAKISYYAALAGRDCAEFWKRINNANYFANPSSDEISCFKLADETEAVDVYDSSGIVGGKVTTTFNLELTFDNSNICSKVTVVYDPNTTCYGNQLLISSDGYNDSCAVVDDPLSPNPRLVKSIYRDKEVVCPTL